MADILGHYSAVAEYRTKSSKNLQAQNYYNQQIHLKLFAPQMFSLSHMTSFWNSAKAEYRHTHLKNNIGTTMKLDYIELS